MIEEYGRIYPVAVNMQFEMQVGCCGSTSLSCECNHLSCLNLIAHIHEILGVMTVPSLKSILMTYLNKITISGISLRHNHLAVESRKDIVVGHSLDIHTCMRSASSSAIGTDYLGSWQGLARHSPVLILFVGSYPPPFPTVPLALAEKSAAG